MKQRWPKTHRGSFDHDLYRSRAFKTKTNRLDKIQEKLTEKMNAGGLTQEQLERLGDQRERVASAIARYSFRTHDEQKLRELKQMYEDLPTVQKLRNEVAHRLRREADIRVKEENIESSREIRRLKMAYAHTPSEEERSAIQRRIDGIEGRQIKSQKLKYDMSLLAASVKLVTGLDDSAAVKRAIEIGKQLPRKDPDFIGEVADDIFLMGEKSIYLKRLNNGGRRNPGRDLDGNPIHD